MEDHRSSNPVTVDEAFELADMVESGDPSLHISGREPSLLPDHTIELSGMPPSPSYSPSVVDFNNSLDRHYRSHWWQTWLREAMSSLAIRRPRHRSLCVDAVELLTKTCVSIYV